MAESKKIEAERRRNDGYRYGAEECGGIARATSYRTYDAMSPGPSLTGYAAAAAGAPPPPPPPPSLPVIITAFPLPAKSLLDAYLLCIPLGFLGLHHFYLKRYGFGVLYFFTGGLLGIGWIVDMFRLPRLVRQTNRMLNNPADDDFRRLSLCDAYLLWFPLGLLGFHQYYLRRPLWGVAYTLTGGLFGIGWIVDAFRLPFLVRDANTRLEMDRNCDDGDRGCCCCCSASSRGHAPVNLCDAYILCLAPPLGLLGVHHLLMRRYANAVFYFFTLGGCGFGWMIDWFRLKCLVDRTNHPERYMLGRRQKFVDDAYVYGFPFGILGLHHFYLERPVWGVLYFFTGGLLGVGWLVDLIRMPCLVREANQRLEEGLVLTTSINSHLQSAATCQGGGGGGGSVVVCASAIRGTPNASVAISGNPPPPSLHPPPPYVTPLDPYSIGAGSSSNWVSVSSSAASASSIAFHLPPPAYSARDNGGYHGYQNP